jgi:excinuclease UvrABC helicase subunit UvrB
MGDFSSLSQQTFKFDKVFKPESTQQEVFNFVGNQIVHDAIKGFNSTVLAYGQTGSGKTYTMYG